MTSSREQYTASPMSTTLMFVVPIQVHPFEFLTGSVQAPFNTDISTESSSQEMEIFLARQSKAAPPHMGVTVTDVKFYKLAVLAKAERPCNEDSI